MSVTNVLQNGLNSIIQKAGQQVRVRTFLKTVGSVWDDDVSLTAQADTWTSGVIMPVRGLTSSESMLMQQGKISNEDKILFMSGTNILGSTNIIKVGLGSPTTEEYTIVPDGMTTWGVYNTDIFSKLYIRKLTNGSLIGE